MPCFRCGARQTDPARGASPWKRGVRAGVQVLVCPECQRGRDWRADFDRCTRCGSTVLVRALGETLCRACGLARPDDPAARAPAPRTPDPGLAEEVAAALDRVLKRAPS